MKFSSLQKYILLLCHMKGGKIERNLFRQFYGKTISTVKEKSFGSAQDKYQENIITKSMEHLIDRELMVGYGKRTPHKWFITHVGLTKKGHSQAQKILNERQEKLPLK